MLYVTVTSGDHRCCTPLHWNYVTPSTEDRENSSSNVVIKNCSLVQLLTVKPGIEGTVIPLPPYEGYTEGTITTVQDQWLGPCMLFVIQRFQCNNVMFHLP